MKIIKTQSNQTQIKLSKSEWQQIGFSSGWLKKQAEGMDLTRQKADTDKLFEAMKTMFNNVTGLRDSANAEASKLVIQRVLDDLKENNWVATLDAEIGLDIQALSAALQSNNIDAFEKRLKSYFKTNLEESKKELDRQMQNQQTGNIQFGQGTDQTQDVAGDVPSGDTLI